MKRIQQHQSFFSYKNKSVEYSLWSNILDGERPDVVIFLGAGQTGAIPRLVAKRGGAGVVVVGGVPHWHASPDAADIEDFTTSYFESAYQKVLATFNCNFMHILAESQAVPSALLLTGKLKGEVGNVCLIRPLGFSAHAFGDTKQVRLKTFRKRILQTFLQYSQSVLYDPRNFIVGLTLVRAMLREPTLTSLSKKYAAGISYDSLKDLQRAIYTRHKVGRTVSFILGERDKMFPPIEITTALESIDTPRTSITVVPFVSHSSLATRASEGVLKMSLEIVRTSPGEMSKSDWE